MRLNKILPIFAFLFVLTLVSSVQAESTFLEKTSSQTNSSLFFEKAPINPVINYCTGDACDNADYKTDLNDGGNGVCNLKVNYLVKGITYNNEVSTGKYKEDYCISSTTLREFYLDCCGVGCADITRYIDKTCPSGYECSDGACVSLDPCAGVTCDDTCGLSNEKRYYGGYCSDGNCYYSYNYDCNNYDEYFCDTGNVRKYKDGYCSSGSCFTSASIIEDCDDKDTSWTYYCEGDCVKRKRQNYRCSLGSCDYDWEYQNVACNGDDDYCPTKKEYCGTACSHGQYDCDWDSECSGALVCLGPIGGASDGCCYSDEQWSTSTNECIGVVCYKDSDCGTDTWLGNEYCSGGNVADTYRKYTCSNPGEVDAECSHKDIKEIKKYCEDTCENGQCVSVACFSDAECGTDLWAGNNYCSSGDVWNIWRDKFCVYDGTSSSYCSYTDKNKLRQSCADTCENGNCVTVNCYSDSDCGTDTWLNNKYCNQGNVWDTWKDYYCTNDGTSYSYCGNTKTNKLRFTCDDKCENGNCVSIECNYNSDCGTNHWMNEPYCSGNNLVGYYRTFTCSNSGTASSACSNQDTVKVKQTCDYGCENAACKEQPIGYWAYPYSPALQEKSGWNEIPGDWWYNFGNGWLWSDNEQNWIWSSEHANIYPAQGWYWTDPGRWYFASNGWSWIESTSRLIVAARAKATALPPEETPEENNEECTDSDKGKNYEIKGEVIYQDKKQADTCETGINSRYLKEWYCGPLQRTRMGTQGPVYFETHDCGEGFICQDGACVQDSNCIDSDSGINYLVKGTIKDKDGKTLHNDYCIPDFAGEHAGKLVEGYCENDELKTELKDCSELGENYYCDNQQGICIKN